MKSGTDKILFILFLLFFLFLKLAFHAFKSQPCTLDGPPKLGGRLLCTLPDSPVTTEVITLESQKLDVSNVPLKLEKNKIQPEYQK